MLRAASPFQRPFTCSNMITRSTDTTAAMVIAGMPSQSCFWRGLVNPWSVPSPWEAQVARDSRLPVPPALRGRQGHRPSLAVEESMDCVRPERRRLLTPLLRELQALLRIALSDLHLGAGGAVANALSAQCVFNDSLATLDVEAGFGDYVGVRNAVLPVSLLDQAAAHCHEPPNVRPGQSVLALPTPISAALLVRLAINVLMHGHDGHGADALLGPLRINGAPSVGARPLLGACDLVGQALLGHGELRHGNAQQCIGQRADGGVASEHASGFIDTHMNTR